MLLGLIIYLAVMFALYGLWLYRAGWVYRVRTDILYADMDEYNRLPSYEAMFYRFWIWDAATFLGMGQDRIEREDKRRERKAVRGDAIIARGRDA